MAHFNKLLLAIDLSPESDLLVNRVVEMCSEDLENLHVIHVIKHGLHNESTLDSVHTNNAHAKRVLDHTATRVHEMLRRNGLCISNEKVYLVNGEPSCEIKKLADKISADLVMVGSHSKSNDWLHLPGATTNCVIQGISSDVMAIKV